MSKAEEIAKKAQWKCESKWLGTDTELQVATIAVDLALEWAAHQCELEAPMPGSDQSLVANACAERIRAGKSK